MRRERRGGISNEEDEREEWGKRDNGTTAGSLLSENE